MKLSQKAIQEFKKIYEEEFGEEISLNEAEIMAGQVMEFITLIYKPPHQNHEDI